MKYKKDKAIYNNIINIMCIDRVIVNCVLNYLKILKKKKVRKEIENFINKVRKEN